jgi:hypothetical protein
MTAPIRVSDVARPLTTDIDPERSIDAPSLDRVIKKTVASVTDALKHPATGYTDFQRFHLSEIFSSLGHTHVSIRNMMRQTSKSPSSVDALALARLQLEGLYSVCLMVEDPSYVDVYIKNGWKDKYVRFLLQREECKDLKRFDDYLQRQAMPMLEKIRLVCGVSPEERATIDLDELGIPLPPGSPPSRIKRFPQPREIIERIKDSTRKQMLERLYPEYRYLCAYAHGSTESAMFKTAFFERSPYRTLLSEAQREDLFQKQVGLPALTFSCLGIVQASCEVAAFYPADIELKRSLIEAWNLFSDVSLLTIRVWEMRTKKLLGIVP